MDNSASENSVHRLHSAGYTKIGAEGYRSEGGLFVPLLQEKELTKFLLASREATSKAALVAQQVEEAAALQATQAIDALSMDDSDELFEAPEPVAFESFEIERLVPCISEEDVNAQKIATEGNLKFNERDRSNAMKALIKDLSTRPLTRKIGMPHDIEMAMEALSQAAPHVPELVKFLRIPLLVAQATGAPPMIRPMLLVGGPGLGKTHLAMKLASILGVSSHLVNYAPAGSAGNSLSGADKSWGNSTTGAVFDTLTQGEFANPVIILEEIDKAASSSSSNGVDRNPVNELLGLLEHSTAKEHRDRCAEIRVDARHIVWVATANSLEGLSAPLLSRFQVILVGRPDARAAVMIASSVAQAVTLQMGACLKPPSGEVLQFLAPYSARVVRRIWMDAAGQAVINRHEEVTMADIEQSIGVIPKSIVRLH